MDVEFQNRSILSCVPKLSWNLDACWHRWRNWQHRLLNILFSKFSFMKYICSSRPANFEKQKFIFWHPKIHILYKKLYFSELRSQNAFWTFIHYHMYFSYGTWMQEGIFTSTIWCQLHRLSSSTVQHSPVGLPVAKPADNIRSFSCQISSDFGQNDALQQPSFILY